MGQDRIIKRLLSKEVLRQAFIPLAPSIREDLMALSRNERQTSVHGEFGKIDQWHNYRDSIQEWISNNRNEIEITIEALNPGIGSDKKQELANWITNNGNDNFMTKVNQVIENDEISTIDIAEKLAEGGVLPMFGMPTSVRNLYHDISCDGQGYNLKSIDRNTDLAIYEFAPGAQKTKDKAIHTSIGFTGDYIVTNSRHNQPVVHNSERPFYNERWMIRCNNGHIDSSYKDRPDINECLECGVFLSFPENIFPIKSPIAYRTNLTIGKDSKDITELTLSRPPILAESSNESTPEPAFDGDNFKATIADRDVAWRINTNGDKFFEGSIVRTGNSFPFNNKQWFNYSGQWLLRGTHLYPNINEERKTNYHFSFSDNGNSFEQIALAAHKNTEIFRLKPRHIPSELTLNMFDQSRYYNYAGIRSAFYSAAFLLQRVVADKLDVDPVEIEIADIRKVSSENGKETAEIILTDELPNGSGFVRKLFNEINQTITESVDSDGARNAEVISEYLLKIHSAEHRHCKDACYDCLKVFRNMNYHGLLDWRLGIALLRVLINRNYLAGVDGQFDGFPELDSWFEDAVQRGTILLKALSLMYWKDLNYLFWCQRQKHII
ncbi:DUF1998 domain-containing protein [Pontibacter rugosus]